MPPVLQVVVADLNFLLTTVRVNKVEPVNVKIADKPLTANLAGTGVPAACTRRKNASAGAADRANARAEAKTN